MNTDSQDQGLARRREGADRSASTNSRCPAFKLTDSIRARITVVHKAGGWPDKDDTFHNQIPIQKCMVVDIASVAYFDISVNIRSVADHTVPADDGSLSNLRKRPNTRPRTHPSFGRDDGHGVDPDGGFHSQ